ncbi:MAG TPA: endonuclease [Actinophytocola sp.]|jgi:hypothetical protein|nr:endonuclease [Actinophytocola sp.]
MATQRKITQTLLDVAGRTYAAEAGIRLADTPSPLYRLLVLSVLLSTRIKADIAVAASRELSEAGFTTPRAMLDATWQQRVDALGRAHYVRYDESTATALGEGAQLLTDSYRGDLRRLRDEAGGDVGTLRRLLRRFPRLGPVGADIFCREAQQVWPGLRPYLDRKALAGAGKIGLPEDPRRLSRLIGADRLAALSAGLIRVGLDRRLADRVRNAG